MRQKIHPRYEDAVIKCVCGNIVNTRATKKEMHVEICSSCHPFYTGGKLRVVDRGGRVERFRKKYSL